jgi:hypothetical protein
MKPMSLQLKNKGCKPVHACPCTVPRSVDQQLHKTIAYFVSIEVLEEDYSSEWISLTFAIAEKSRTKRICL